MDSSSSDLPQKNAYGGLRAHRALKAHTSPRAARQRFCRRKAVEGLGRIRRLRRTLPPRATAPPDSHTAHCEQSRRDVPKIALDGVPYALTCLECFSSKLPQKRHPERSASQIYRAIPHLVARSRRTPRMLSLPMPFEAFQPPKPRPGGPVTVFPWGRSRTVGILRCPADTATSSAVTAAYGCKRLLEGYEDIRKAIAREKQLKGWRREKRLNLIRTINPEFKDLAQTWGRKMITAPEKMYP